MRPKEYQFILIIAVVVSLALSAACGKNRQTTPREGAAPATTPTLKALTPLPSRPLSPGRARALEGAKEAAAAMRELAWKDEARMTELTGWEYGTRSREMAEILGGNELRALSQLAVAGGMLPAGTDLAMLAASFTAASAGASYSPLDKRVLLLQQSPSSPDKRDTSGQDSLLAHELVHALQDQHFDLLRLLLARPYNFDRTEALFSIIEGDAMSVQRRLELGEAWTRRPVADVGRLEDERFNDYRREIGALFPPLLTETFIFRYRDGVRFVETVRRKTGARGVNDLFRRPPASSEQVLHPEKYLAGEEPRHVAFDVPGFAAAGWERVVASTPLGEIGARGLLLRALSPAAAARAAAGWGGDSAQLFEGTNRAPLFVWKTVWDRPEDATEFFRAYHLLRPRGSDLIGQSFDASQSSWREGDRITLVRQDGEQVVIIRGAPSDIERALEIARR